ncbi:MAG: sigma 54-interacting transcriptional regulator [Synergistaceae bacterium]|nr:sigma 54-interacting transcriptional regulator [Synergistaceae bacterium]
MNIDINICFAYKNNKAQAEHFADCKDLVNGVISSLTEQGRNGGKLEFSHLSGKIRPCSEIHEADFIIGDPSHPNFHEAHNSELEPSLRPVPAVILLPDDTWGDDVNSVLKNPVYDIRGIFRASKLYPESRDAEEFARLCEVMKTIIRRILRHKGLREEDFSKPAEWKVKISEGCEIEFASLFSTPAMQRMSAKYKDALLALDDKFLRELRERLGDFMNLAEHYRKIRNLLDNKVSFHVPSLLILGETGCGKSLLAGVAAGVIMPGRKLARVNISSYDTNSIDVMLFGAKEGSFTSSKEDIPGLFIGHCGEAVFLDEIGDMNPESQTRLLTYMDNAQVLPRGMADSVCAPCILIAATNKDVRNDASFRKDILSRFDHIIEIPSLRERKQDLRLLVSMILQDGKINPVVGERRKAERISLDAVSYLEGRDYPGNFRELKFCISQAVNNAFSEGCNCLCLRHFYSR